MKFIIIIFLILRRITRFFSLFFPTFFIPFFCIASSPKPPAAAASSIAKPLASPTTTTPWTLANPPNLVQLFFPIFLQFFLVSFLLFFHSSNGNIHHFGGYLCEIFPKNHHLVLIRTFLSKFLFKSKFSRNFIEIY